MNQVWLKIIAVMLAASVAKYFIAHALFWVAIDLAALGICYLIIRRYPYVDLRRTMLFLGTFTLISILVDIRVISAMLGNILSLAVIVWLLWRGGNVTTRRQPLRHKWHK